VTETKEIKGLIGVLFKDVQTTACHRGWAKIHILLMKTLVVSQRMT
jgi:hypothetical protein